MKQLFIKSLSLKFLALLALFAWFLFLFVRPIDITTGDLPRHIKNGEIIAGSLVSGVFKTGILTTNLYSYTNPDFPFINHHWATGLVFYGLWSVFGLGGIQIFGTLLSLITLILFFVVAKKESNFWLAFSLAFFLVPLIADRRDIRPELFSYLFFGILVWLLTVYSQTKNRYYLLPIPFIFLAWVNFHIYFIFGFAVLGIFFLSAVIKKITTDCKQLGLIIGFSILAGMVNPFGWKIFTYPFTILENYGITVQENRPLWQATEIDPARALTFCLALALFWFLILVVGIKDWKKLEVKFLLLALLFSVLGVRMIRNLSLFGLFFLPLLAVAIRDFLAVYDLQKYRAILVKPTSRLILVGVVISMTLLISQRRLPEAWKNFGWQAAPIDLEAAQFLKDNQIKGKMFNDFGTGGYLILYLYPELRPFVDQRPEAYPADFLKNDYSVVRSNEVNWQRVNEKYDFSIIFLALAGKSQANLNFIIDRLNDPLWVPVFRNNKHLIFLRRTPANASIIAKFKISKEDFMASGN